VDTLGDYGLSVLQHKLKDHADCAEWLEDVFDGLQLKRAGLVGHSYGGWQALNYALHSPQRIERLVLLAPAYTLLRIYFNFWFLHVLPMQTIPNRSSVNSFIKYVSALPQANILFKEMVEQLYQGVKNIRFPPQIVRPFVFSDDELRTVIMPTLVVIGDKEVIYDPQAALERATRLIPCCETEIIPNAGHDLMRDQPALVNRSILQFLNGQVRHVRANPSLQIG
jgi:pimeloyl-ACP methyl ester carboxylesterase